MSESSDAVQPGVSRYELALVLAGDPDQTAQLLTDHGQPDSDRRCSSCREPWPCTTQQTATLAADIARGRTG